MKRRPADVKNRPIEALAAAMARLMLLKEVQAGNASSWREAWEQAKAAIQSYEKTWGIK